MVPSFLYFIFIFHMAYINSKGIYEYEDLLEFAKENFPKAMKMARMLDVYYVKIHRRKKKLLTTLSNFLNEVKESDVVSDQILNGIISKSQKYQKAINDMQEFRKEGNEFRRVNTTGLESHLKGKYYEQIVELNNYIYTTASTINPGDEKVENMYLNFYLKRSDALKLADYLQQIETKPVPQENECLCNYYDHGFWIYDEVDHETIGQFGCIEGAKKFYERHGRQFDIVVLKNFLPLFQTKDPLVYMEVHDNRQEKRDLYEIILHYFHNNKSNNRKLL
jgi:hypothetical protein